MVSRKRVRSKKEIKSESRELESVNSSNISGLLCKKMQSRKSIKTNFHNQQTAEDSEMKCCECWETTREQRRKMAGSNVRAAETGCTSFVLHTKTNASTAEESYCERKTRCRKGI